MPLPSVNHIYHANEMNMGTDAPSDVWYQCMKKPETGN
jgi:hypothetical protein